MALLSGQWPESFNVPRKVALLQETLKAKPAIRKENILSVQDAAAHEHTLAQELSKLAEKLKQNNEVLQSKMHKFRVN